MISERIRNDFGSEIEKVFEIIYNHPNYTSQQIAKEVGKTSRTIEAYQAKLKNADIIERKGAKLGGYWVVKNLNL
jgi:predicted HTH transcriptional regulator